MLVHDYLTRCAQRFSEKTAVVHGTRRATYGAIDRMTSRAARVLIEAGVRRGDRVIVFLPNSLEAVVAIFAVLKAGAVFVPLNTGMKAGKLGYIFENSGANAVVTDGTGFGTVRTALANAEALVFVTSPSAPDPSTTVSMPTGEGNGRDHGTCDEALTVLPLLVNTGSPDEVPGDETGTGCTPLPDGAIDQDLACLIYTSGSTGEPKGVVCGHNNVVFASGSIVEYLENTPDDTVISVLPFSFDYGLYQLLMVFRFGGTLVIENAFAYPAAILRTIERERVTGFPCVPTLVAMLLKLDLGRFDLRSVRYITNTAAALPPAHIRLLRDRLPSVRIYSMYGLTECKRALYLPPERLTDKSASVGIAIPGTEVWLEDEMGARVGPGETGELFVRGSHVMRGYWADRELTERVYRPGPTPGERVLRTGDLFRMDEEGFLYFVSRKDDIIKSRGEKVAPKEVETAIYELDGVVEVAVVGVPDEVLGESIVAYVVPAGGAALTEQQVRRHCTARLEAFMVPQQVVFAEALPRNPSGKVDRKELVIYHA